MVSSLAVLYRDHRYTVIGTGAVIVGAAAGLLALRRSPAPSIIVSAPAGSSGVDAATLTSAYGAGAAAASSGLQVGSDLGQSALGLAGNVVATQGGGLQSLVDLFTSLFQPVPLPVQPPASIMPVPNPTPTPAPAPAPLPAHYVSIPASGAVVRVYTLKNGAIVTFRDVPVAGPATWAATAQYHVLPNATVVKLQAGPLAGQVIRGYGNGVSAH